MVINYDNLLPTKAPGDQFTASEANAINDFVVKEIGRFSNLVKGCWYPNNDPLERAANGLLYEMWMAMALIPPGWRLPTRDDWNDFGFNFSTFGTELELPNNGYSYENGVYYDRAQELQYMSAISQPMTYIYTVNIYAGVGSQFSGIKLDDTGYYVRYVKDDDGSANTVQTFEWLGDTYRYKKLSDGNIWFLDNFKAIPTGLSLAKYNNYTNQFFVKNSPGEVFHYLNTDEYLNTMGIHSSEDLLLSQSDILSLGTTAVQPKMPNSVNFHYSPIAFMIDYTYNTSAYSNQTLIIRERSTTRTISTQFQLNFNNSGRVFNMKTTSGTNALVTIPNNPLEYTTASGNNPVGGDGTIRIRVFCLAMKVNP